MAMAWLTIEQPPAAGLMGCAPRNRENRAPHPLRAEDLNRKEILLRDVSTDSQIVFIYPALLSCLSFMTFIPFIKLVFYLNVWVACV